MNGEMNHIKEFVKKNLEEGYYEMAEEMMLINPFCGVIKKLIDSEYSQVAKVKNENLKLQVLNNHLEKKTKILEKRGNEIIEIEDTHGIQYNEFSNDMDKLYEIKTVIQKYFDVNIDRKTRQREVVYAREMAMYYGRKLTDASQQVIGRIMGNKDHSTVVHAVMVIENLMYYKKTRIHISELNKIFIISP